LYTIQKPSSSSSIEVNQDLAEIKSRKDLNRNICLSGFRKDEKEASLFHHWSKISSCSYLKPEGCMAKASEVLISLIGPNAGSNEVGNAHN